MADTLLSTGEQRAFTGPEGDDVSVRITPRMRSHSGDPCVAAALAHQGIVLQPSFMVGTHLQSSALREVLPQYRSMEFGVYAGYPSRKHLAPKVRRLVDYLVEALGGGAGGA